MADYKFKVGDKVKQNGKGSPYKGLDGLIGTVTRSVYAATLPIQRVWVDYRNGDGCLYYRDFELDLVEAKQEFVAYEDLQVGKSYILQDTSFYDTPQVGDVVIVTWLGADGAMLKNTTNHLKEHTFYDGVYHLHFSEPKLTEIPETVAPKAETNMTEYVTNTCEYVPAQVKVTKTINSMVDVFGPGNCYLSIRPYTGNKGLVDIVIGSKWAGRVASAFDKRTLGELIDILKEVHEAMESN